MSNISHEMTDKIEVSEFMKRVQFCLNCSNQRFMIGEHMESGERVGWFGRQPSILVRSYCIGLQLLIISL